MLLGGSVEYCRPTVLEFDPEDLLKLLYKSSV